MSANNLTKHLLRLSLATLAAGCAMHAMADDMGHAMDHGSMDMNMQGGGSAPADARDPDAWSDGYRLDNGPYLVSHPHAMHMSDDANFGSVLLDRLERTHTDNDNATAYEMQAWFGSTWNRLTLKAEGEADQGRLHEARTELLWSHAVAPFWDTQLGIRNDTRHDNPSRNWLAFGVQGLAPYWFDVEATAYVGSNGRTAIRLSAEYELLLTQRLILQPRVEANLYGKSDPATDIGSGLSNSTAGLRLRYELSRQFAPYVGVERQQYVGTSADLIETAGGRRESTRLVAGVRLWF